MTYKTHLSAGLLFSSTYFLLINQINLSPILILGLAVSAILGASTPDLDTPTGGLWQKIPGGGILSRIIHPVFIGGHRHLSHSIIGLGIFTGIFYLLLKTIPYETITDNSKFIILAYAIGYVSHIIADMFTESGVPLLFPWDYHFGIPPAPFEKVRIKTGRWFENFVIYPIINLLLLILLYKSFV